MPERQARAEAVTLINAADPSSRMNRFYGKMDGAELKLAVAYITDKSANCYKLL